MIITRRLNYGANLIPYDMGGGRIEDAYAADTERMVCFCTRDAPPTVVNVSRFAVVRGAPKRIRNFFAAIGIEEDASA